MIVAVNYLYHCQIFTIEIGLIIPKSLHKYNKSLISEYVHKKKIQLIDFYIENLWHRKNLTISSSFRLYLSQTKTNLTSHC